MQTVGNSSITDFQVEVIPAVITRKSAVTP